MRRFMLPGLLDRQSPTPRIHNQADMPTPPPPSSPPAPEERPRPTDLSFAGNRDVFLSRGRIVDGFGAGWGFGLGAKLEAAQRRRGPPKSFQPRILLRPHRWRRVVRIVGSEMHSRDVTVPAEVWSRRCAPDRLDECLTAPRASGLGQRGRWLVMLRLPVASHSRERSPR